MKIILFIQLASAVFCHAQGGKSKKKLPKNLPKAYQKLPMILAEKAIVVRPPNGKFQLGFSVVLPDDPTNI